MDFVRCEAGSLESSDCLVTIEPSNNFSIDIKSTVDRQFYNSILTDTKKTHPIPNYLLALKKLNQNRFNHLLIL